MRKTLWAGIFGSLMVTSLAACGTDGTPAGNPVTPASTPAPVGSTPSTPGAAPGAGTPLADVATWIKAGTQVDRADFEDRGPDGIAFLSPDGKMKCYASGGIGCEVDLQNPPPDPREESRVPWRADLVYAIPGRVDIGEYSGPPNPWLLNEPVNELPYGSTVTTSEGLICRMDQAGLYCLAQDAKSAYRISDAGVVSFGCLVPSTKGREVLRC